LAARSAEHPSWDWEDGGEVWNNQGPRGDDGITITDRREAR
jgi:hypothetical protein